MRSSPNRCSAVITGDIVRSGRLTSQRFKAVQESLHRGSRTLEERFPRDASFPIDVFRGDSWQMLVPDPRDALRVGLFLRAFLRAEGGVDTRLAIGVGTTDGVVRERVGESRGDAFRVSGELLDKKSPSRMRFRIAGTESWWGEHAIAVVLAVLDVVAARWTSAQGRAICGALFDWKQEQIAERWPGEAITQQAAGQHLARAGWDGVREAVGYYESTMGSWLGQ